MSEWRGLHNPHRHEAYWAFSGSADCQYATCGETCTRERPCYCCLAAEVEVLRAENERLRRAFSRPKRLPPTDYSGMTG